MGFFNNFVLLASFLGIGVGILLGRRGVPAVPPFGVLLLTLVALVYASHVDIRQVDDVRLFLASPAQLEVSAGALSGIVALVAAVMAAAALPLGRLLRAMPPARAYAVDIAGSLSGIALFTALSAAGTPPAAWFATLGALLAAGGLIAGLRPAAAATAVPLVAVVLLAAYAGSFGDRWSPYYRVSVFGSRVEVIAVNGIPHQHLFAVGDPDAGIFYGQVGRWFPERRFRDALVIGAGSGSDVAVLLSRGVGHVDAVEIDPLIARIGAERHPDRPYDDPRVRVVVDDGRAFLATTQARYDLVVFAFTDSLTLVTQTANLRLESFLFTREAFASARDHLADDGLFVMYNNYREPFVVERYARTLAETFGLAPIARFGDASEPGAVVLADGPLVASLEGRAPPGDRTDRVSLAGAPEPARDDHPFPYLAESAIAPGYLVALGALLAFAVATVLAALGASGGGGSAASPHFFLLGAAFLLLETRSIVAFSLLFGTTWLVNALVISAILASVLTAIAVSVRLRPPPAPLYAALFGSLALAWLLPPDALLIEPAWLRYAAASAIAFAPVFCANLVFTHSFRRTRAADVAFASNLVGAVAGGVLEWGALLVGYRALLVVIALLYVAAGLAGSRWRVLGDRALVGGA